MAITAAVPDDESHVARSLEDLRRQAREDRAAVADTVRPIVSDLARTIEDKLATGYYTKSATDGAIASKVANPGAISPTSMSSSGPVSGASVSTGGTVSGGGVTASGDLRGATLYATGAPGYNITGTRVAGWWESATGRAGTASSSRRYKEGIVPADLDPDAVLALEVVHFHYIAEVRKRDDPTYADYVGPDYHVSTEVGLIAEELHARGLWEFVVYQRRTVTATRTRTVERTRPVVRMRTVLDEDGNETEEPFDDVETYSEDETFEVVVGDELVLGEDGEPIPDGVHYELLALALLPVVQRQEQRLAAIEARLDALTPTEESNP